LDSLTIFLLRISGAYLSDRLAKSAVSIYGLNIESVTIVVSGFMLGLGLGSLVGGRLSNSRRLPPVALFAMAELFTGIFGIVSLNLFRRIAEFTARTSPLETRLIGSL
jgi:predicted membrane-bound spermidine synthase